MIYQPRNVNPSGISIDALLDNTFTMEIQTNNYVSAYQLLINDFDNNQIYAGEKIELSTFAYNGDTISIPVNTDEVMLSNGSDYKWRVRLYQPTADMLITYGVIQATSTTTELYLQTNINIREGMSITINGQTQQITSYDVNTGIATVATAFSVAPEVGAQYKIHSDFIETIPDYIFYARQTPSVSISNIPETVSLKYHTFNGNYEQTDNVAIVYHQFDLYVKNSDGSMSLVNTTGRVYSANLSYSYDAFRTGNTYYIQMTIENDMGIISTTDLYSFNVNYEIIEYLQQPHAVLDERRNAVNISWVAPIEHEGQAIKVGSKAPTQFNYLYNTPYNLVNSMHTNGYEAIWQSEDGLCVLPENFNITLQFNPDSNFFFDENGDYIERVEMITSQTDDENGGGEFKIIIDKNKIIFEQNPDINLEASFYSDTNQLFVLTSTGAVQLQGDYVWDDNAAWNDSYFWTEGGTSLQRVCNHWWKIQITNTGIKIEEIYPTV